MNAIFNGGVAATMTSQEIADLVESRHDSVKRTIERLSNQGVITFPPLVEKASTRGRPAAEFVFSGEKGKRDSIIVVAQLSPEFTARLVDRWQQLEVHSATGFAIPTTLSGALMLAAEQAATIERQQAEIAGAAPKVKFVDRYVEATGNKGFRQVAKLLKANEARFREFLEDRNVMYRLGGEWSPYQNHIDAGRFVIKTGVSESEHAYNHAKFTPKGIEWIASLWAVYCLRDSDAREAA